MVSTAQSLLTLAFAVHMDHIVLFSGEAPVIRHEIILPIICFPVASSFYCELCSFWVEVSCILHDKEEREKEEWKYDTWFLED